MVRQAVLDVAGVDQPVMAVPLRVLSEAELRFTQAQWLPGVRIGAQGSPRPFDEIFELLVVAETSALIERLQATPGSAATAT